MRSRLILLIAIAIVLSAAYHPLGAFQQGTFRDLFNGKDLTGWVNVNTDKDTWKVKDGLLICSGSRSA